MEGRCALLIRIITFCEGLDNFPPHTGRHLSYQEMLGTKRDNLKLSRRKILIENTLNMSSTSYGTKTCFINRNNNIW